jgi:hypothetical protein
MNKNWWRFRSMSVQYPVTCGALSPRFRSKSTVGLHHPLSCRVHLRLDMVPNDPNCENHTGGDEHAEMRDVARPMVSIAATFEDFSIQMAIPLFHYMFSHASS